ncbi:MAG: carbonate dehydratase [Gammaproteobacteria bacterium]|nr:carbonate dehydratase [Gammaproteobacteria bacterium]
MADPAPTPPADWHAREPQAAFDHFQTDPGGLDAQTAKTRLEEYGRNELRPPEKQSRLKRFALQFHNLLIYVLLAAALVTLLLQHWVDSGVILGVVLINALIGHIQEGKAEKALDAIRRMLSQQAMVKRDNAFITLPATEVVPGDILSLQSGDKVPADVRLFKVKDLRIDEAILTGESEAVEKDTRAVAETAVLGDRTCMAYSGTLVSYGHGLGVVVATGEQTEIGRISGMLGQVESLTTPLLRQMAQFARWLTGAILVLATATFVYGVGFQAYSAADMFLAAVGLAVAAIPEGLPAIMTITLAIGVQRMARRNAIIRRLPAVETLGSVTVICSDKTGTLTHNEMMVQEIICDNKRFEVSGSGYDPHGGFTRDGETVDPDTEAELTELMRAGILCNDSSLTRDEQGWHIHGDPTEGALLTLGRKGGLDLAYQHEQWPRTDVIPFESMHKFMATLHHDHAGHAFIYLKGAPERVLEMCTCQRVRGEDIPLDHEEWARRMHVMAEHGQRLLALAYRGAAPEQRELRFEDVNGGLTLLGVVGLIDPPREDAIQAIRTCRSAGIRVKMITGDHAVTAKSIGEQMGIGEDIQAINGTDLDQYDDAQLQRAAIEASVFARTSPEHKLRLVSTLQADGAVVAMTGDGVNDAPALKRADVGIAMGMKGTEVSKEASEMVLADDNFASIAHAVEEGRTVYDNLKKSILFILPTNGGQALAIIAAILGGYMLPITPVQILWVNMVTAVTLALALAFEPAEKDVMQRPPRNAREPLLTGFLIWRILLVSVILVSGSFGLFILERNAGVPIDTARTIAVNTLVSFEIFYLFCARYLLAPSLNWEGLTGNRYVLIAVGVLILLQLAFTYLPPMQYLFGTAPIGLDTWGRILLVALSVVVIVELEKWGIRRHLARRQRRAAAA